MSSLSLLAEQMKRLDEKIDAVDTKIDEKHKAVNGRLDRLTKNLRDVIFLLCGLLASVVGAIAIEFLSR